MLTAFAGLEIVERQKNEDKWCTDSGKKPCGHLEQLEKHCICSHVVSGFLAVKMLKSHSVVSDLDDPVSQIWCKTID